MSFISNLLKKTTTENNTNDKGSVEEFVSLIRVYYQAVMAINLGITNMNMLPDMALFKRMLKIPTQNNKLGIAERSRVRKILMSEYGLDPTFFKEIDLSIKKNCKNQNDIKSYFLMFQGFSQDLFNMISTQMEWKFRLAMIFKPLIHKMTKKSVHKIFTQQTWDDVSAQKSAWNIRKYAERLHYSETWVNNFVYNILLMAREDSKRESKNRKKD